MQMEGFNDSAQLHMFHINSCLLFHPTLHLTTTVPRPSLRASCAIFPQLEGNPGHETRVQRGMEKPQQWNQQAMEQDSLLVGALTFLVTAGSR